MAARSERGVPAASHDAPEGPRFTLGRVSVVLVVLVALLWFVPIATTFVETLDFREVAHPYALIFGFVTLDAVFPVLLSESLLNTASTLAAQDGSTIEVWRVALMGWLGAVIGDTLLYWLARNVLRRHMENAVAKVEANDTVAQVLRMMHSSAAPVIMFGRFVPGVRFAVGATMGLSRFPFPRFLLWDAIGGGIWSVSTCAIAYFVGSVIEDKPIISLAVSAVVTTAVLALLLRSLRSSWKMAAATADEPIALPT